MKKRIFLASFMQKENFGKGRIISITTGTKPSEYDVNNIYLPLTPPHALIESYNKMAQDKPEEAGTMFTNSYKTQIESFITEVSEEAKKLDKKPHELLPFEDGDTLCSWERNFRTNYRKVLAPYLEKLGYDVVLN